MIVSEHGSSIDNECESCIIYYYIKVIKPHPSFYLYIAIVYGMP